MDLFLDDGQLLLDEEAALLSVEDYLHVCVGVTAEEVTDLRRGERERGEGGGREGGRKEKEEGGG